MILLPLSKKLTQLFMPLALAASILLAGCAVHARVYDPYYRDYHPWAGENTFYLQWETETHHDHRDFDRRSDQEKKEYWDWRHSHDNH